MTIINYIKSTRWLVVSCVATIIGLASCSNYLELDPKISGQLLIQNYYQDSTQCYSALAAAYGGVRVNSGCFYNQIATMNSGSDECYCGGGTATDGGGMQNFSNYTLDATNVGVPGSIQASTPGPAYLWYSYYLGITNANILLDNIDNSTISDGLKTRMVAECKALRGYYYFNLVRMWGNIPLLLHQVSASAIYDVTQSSMSDVYKQIEQDLTEAIPDLPMMLQAVEAGRFTQGAATALLGKVYLFEGDGVPGAKNPDGSAALTGDPSKYALAAQTLAKVNGPQNGATFSSPYGYQLLTHYADLWSNKLTNATPLFGNAPGRFNSEAIFEDVHTNQALNGWAADGVSNYTGIFLGNMMCTMVGPRGYAILVSGQAPQLSGVGAWSFNPITPDCYDFMKNNMTGTDSRFSASILDMKALADAGYVAYAPGFMNTGYFLNKFMPLVSDQSTLAGNAELNFQQDSYIIRLADTYLMEAEALLKGGGDASRALALVNAVRLRAGATPLAGALTLQQIYDERRLELMGEGMRWFDLVRTGQAATALASRGFKAGMNEFFPIPFLELQNQNFKQNYGYPQ